MKFIISIFNILVFSIQHLDNLYSIYKMYLESNRTHALKIKRKNKFSIIEQLPQQAQIFQNAINEAIFHRKWETIQERFKFYNITFIEDLWLNMEQDKKLQMVKAVEIQYIKEGQVISNFKAKKQVNQVKICVYGKICYRLMIDNNIIQCEYPVKQGQIIYHCCPLDWKFKQFSLIGRSACLVIKIGLDSYLGQKIVRLKQNKINNLLMQLKKLNENEEHFKKSLNLIPYFSLCRYKKGEIIYSKAINQGCFYFVSQGEVEIVSKVDNTKQINIVQLMKGQFIETSVLNECHEDTIIRCKSIQCSIYTLPLVILNFFGNMEIKQSIMKQNQASKMLYDTILKTNQKVMKNPNQKRTNLKRKKKKVNSSLQHNKWDLVQHFAKQMKIKSPFLKQMERNYHSAHSTKRKVDQHSSLTNLNSIDRLKKKAVTVHLDEQQSTAKQKSNSLQCSLKSPFKIKSTFFKSIPRFTHLDVPKQARETLVKKTKFKLLRYAQGQNLYSLDDYF